MLQLPPPFYSWSQLFEKWITLSTGQITTLRITQVVFQILIRWIVIYTMDSAIQRLNNTGLDEATSLLFIRLFPGLSLLLRGNYWELKPSRQRQDQQCQKKNSLRLHSQGIGRIFGKQWKIRALRCSVHTEHANCTKIQPDSSGYCKQSENIERFRVNEVPCQIFHWAGRKFVPCRVNAVTSKTTTRD